MATIISFNQNDFDYDQAVGEVDLIISSYLENLHLLEEVESVHDLPGLISNSTAYSNRLEILMRQLETLEDAIDFNTAILDTLQLELSALEKAYMLVDQQLNKTVENVHQIASLVLGRMDTVLMKMGFSLDHDQRQFIREVMSSNSERRRCRLMLDRYKQAVGT